MSDNKFRFLNHNDAITFEKFFEERKKEDNITYIEFKDIVNTNINFSKNIITEIFELVKKKKDRFGNMHDSAIYICNYF